MQPRPVQTCWDKASFHPIRAQSHKWRVRYSLKILGDLVPDKERTGWEVAKGVAADYSQTQLKQTFLRLAEQWRRETRHISSLTRTAIHPAYQSIIGMGTAVISLILRELEERGGHWLWALHAITREDPAKPGDDLDTAVRAWLSWGRSRGYIDCVLSASLRDLT